MKRVKIGLALGSGSAKGWAHIGVIRALEEMGIRIDVVAGCSIGSLVGAAYASHRLDELEGWIRSFSYWDVVRMLDVSWHRGGFVQGNRIFKHLKQIIPITQIEECQRKFGTVATNLSLARELWFTEGDLHLAMRASCSIPGLFSPVHYRDYWVVDGGVVNPVPISLTRALGADVVIAVDLQRDTHLLPQTLANVKHLADLQVTIEPSQHWHERLSHRWSKMVKRNPILPPSAAEIMASTIQVLENRVKLTRMAGDPPDVLLQPDCEDISTLDFHRAEETIAAGRLAVEKQRLALSPLSE